METKSFLRLSLSLSPLSSHFSLLLRSSIYPPLLLQFCFNFPSLSSLKNIVVGVGSENLLVAKGTAEREGERLAVKVIQLDIHCTRRLLFFQMVKMEQKDGRMSINTTGG